MNYTIVDVEQGTPAWYAARVGRVTSSRAEDATAAPTRRGVTELKARIDYRIQIVAERLTGRPQGKEFTSKDTDRGHELEPLALAAYEAERRPATSKIVLANRGNGPEQVMQMVQERAPDGFARIEDVLSAAELEGAAAGYKRLAGFDVGELNSRGRIVAP